MEPELCYGINDSERSLFNSFCIAKEYVLNANKWLMVTKELVKKAMDAKSIDIKKIQIINSNINNIQQRVDTIVQDLEWLKKQHIDVFDMFVDILK